MRSTAALGGTWRDAIVSDPLARPVAARWLLLEDGRAVVEAAPAIGLPLLTPGERDPLVASSRGLGELVLAALREERPRAPRRPRRERDGGRRSGCARGPPRAPGPDEGSLRRTHDPGGRRAALRPAEGCVAGGRRGAGAAARGHGRAPAVRGASPGAGAAGGLGAAFAALGAELVAGAPAVLDLVGFDEQACATQTSSSPAKVRSTRRRPKARPRASSPCGAPRRASAASSSEDASSPTSSGAETVACQAIARRPRTTSRPSGSDAIVA